MPYSFERSNEAWLWCKLQKYEIAAQNAFLPTVLQIYLAIKYQKTTTQNAQNIGVMQFSLSYRP